VGGGGGGGGAGGAQKVLSKLSADSFAVGRRQKVYGQGRPQQTSQEKQERIPQNTNKHVN
jgi:hypothetical protein